MKRSDNGLRVLFLLMLCICLCLAFAFAHSEGNYTEEEDGSRWYDDGRIVWPDGSVTWQVDHDQGQTHDDGGSSAGTVVNDDGSITVVTDEEDPTAGAKKNPDGSIEIESGTGGVNIETEPTRAPLEGAEWDAALAGVAARNGQDTPTVWRDPAGNLVSVDVVYMGIGRSMICVNGENRLVNTVDLRWETEAPEDKVLAVVKSKYVWMRKQPSNEITNLKFNKIYRDTTVRVLGTGKNWTFVDYGGYRGYVATGGLEFYCNDHTDFDAAFVSVKGKLKGKDPVQLRARVNHGILEQQVKAGTPITVFDIIDDYAEVDVEGKHCIIMAAYITLERDLAAAE